MHEKNNLSAKLISGVAGGSSLQYLDRGLVCDRNVDRILKSCGATSILKNSYALNLRAECGEEGPKYKS